MTNKYQHNYIAALTNKGREICIADGFMSYCYPLADSADDAVANFAETYDFAPDTDDDPASIWADLCVTEYLDGEEVDCFRHRITGRTA